MSPIDTAKHYQAHAEARAAGLRDRNHAHQVRVDCIRCGELFDVGRERAKHPTFLPICHNCWIKEHP
ncbi:hypothetical protein SEA_KIKO_54 [Gordonia phage Kiko]|uniref:hypothetical protein n=1 Tax=Gordonia rubripertincta TaxID=36822 RepID=UPI000FDFA130|nr:hypothetical protein [Gordonia rubripertincta]AZV00776.1 hypothetical protein SEA_KIKO_54 [Gordonia phage Kiko]QMU22524.1 hypothetical protein H3V45_08675 [Gordonia rubripertincta]